ncbi:MAG TPA: RloB domain-containing protein, partial [Candidatus Dojkabacteria bacterium]|nr:RloB domain-containing protein [Candidatus Dojkabacteria bacterium]
MARKKSLRAPYERVLIVCEGDTERLYFEEIRKEYRLQTTNIKVTNSDLGTNPRQVVEFALHLFQ